MRLGAVFETSEVNAFATGMRKHHALVAVSTGLLDRMTENEAEAVVDHEISHIANGDMITLALIQGVVNTFVIFLSRVIGQFVDKAIFKNPRGHEKTVHVASAAARADSGASGFRVNPGCPSAV